ncbi:MAG: LamG domain-containing protein, partial [Planctomycetes bacterium]|nr:LamG domain-containing protein [Planctomycetota bacterium]
MRSIVTMLVAALASLASAAQPAEWWNPQWQFRTTVQRPVPYRDGVPRPVEAAVDFAQLLNQAGVAGAFDPGSLRVIQRDSDGTPRELPSVWRTGFNARLNMEQGYLTWFVGPQTGHVGTAEIYFDIEQRNLAPPRYDRGDLPLDNLLANASFEQSAGDLPADWKVEPAALVRVDRFRHTTGQRSLKVVVDESTPGPIRRDVAISQRVDVCRFAGQEVVFQCDLMAEQAAYGAPVAIAIEQFREDGSRIRENAVDPRWLNIELAQGQLVQFSERGHFSRQAATANVLIRMRCSARDADTGQTVDGPDARFTVWLDRVVLRPGERWPWPAETHGGFVPGALTDAPVNRGFEFTGLRRIAFNGASEATLTTGYDDPDSRSVHWGLAAGTLEFWCQPAWNADDRHEHVFFDAVAYGHRLQSRLRKLDGDGRNRLEFSIADAGGTLRSVRAFAPFRAGVWHHVAVAWDFPHAKLSLFFDGQPIGSTEEAGAAWPSSLVSNGTTAGIGIAERDSRSMPMQAFIGGDADCQPGRSAEAVLDEFRISDCVRYVEGFKPSRQEYG